MSSMSQYYWLIKTILNFTENKGCNNLIKKNIDTNN